MMKKSDILLAVGIIAIAVLAVVFLSQRKGYLRIETPGVELRLGGGFGRSVTVRSSAEPVELTARRYSPRRLQITAQQDGSTWKLISQGPWGALGTLAVTGGETTQVAVGPPFRVRPEVSSYRTRVSIGWAIYGRAGEKYQNTVWKNNGRVPAPQLRIIDREGNVLASGRFQYG